MGVDWDDVFAYTTAKRVTVRHRWLGITYYSLLVAISAYIFGYQIAYEKQYAVDTDVTGAVRANVQGVGADKL